MREHIRPLDSSIQASEVGGDDAVFHLFQKVRVQACLCGGIKIKVEGKLRKVINCHCSQCMKTHGNFAAYTNCLEENLTFINKKSLKWYNSSKFAKRG